MDALKLRKEVSKPGLLQAARAVFDPVVAPVSGRKFSIGACLMSGAGGVSGKHASLLQFDVSMHGDTVMMAHPEHRQGECQIFRV